ncbi:MAG TPA: hypothetical protein VIF09_12720, partial [Polyangiaceae bacterium]
MEPVASPTVPAPSPTALGAPLPAPVATPEPPPPPRRDPVALIRDELGPDAPVVQEPPFVLAGPAGSTAMLEQVTRLVRSALAALYNGRFSTRPSPVAVYLFSSRAPYERFCRSRLGSDCISPY